MQKKFNILMRGSVVLLLALSACTKETEKIIIEKQAPTNVLETFSKPAEDVCAKASCITIQKSSLGRIHLLLISGKTGGSAPQWYDVKPLVVSFDRAGSKVALLAQNYNSIYENIKTEDFIASFDILSEDDKEITFDWGRGLETLIVQSSYQIESPLLGLDDLKESSYRSMPITGLYVPKITYDSKNIEVVQISRVSTSVVKNEGKKTSIENREETLALNIQIRAYNLSSQFQKKLADKSRRVGFFVTKKSVKSRSEQNDAYITKWDIDPSRGPITVQITDTVQPEFLQAVKDGVLYWNIVFGREVIKVQAGIPDSEATPKDRTITLRWVDWIDAGAAYAIGQSDPMTGEVLRAQVFMPAAFTEVSPAGMVRMNGGSPVVGAVACDLTQKAQELQGLSVSATPAVRLRLAQSYVRSTVAHEMGHALGLRHNFAGSYSVKAKTPDVIAAAEAYLKDPNHPGLETSTSIMDYVAGLEETLMSAHILHSPLAYDKMAMEWAYSKDDKALDEKISGYCSDEDIALANSQGMAIYGCERFDAGNNPMWRKYLGLKYEKEEKVAALFALLLDRVYRDKGAKTLDEGLVEVQAKARASFAANMKFIRQALANVTVNGIASQPMLSRQSIKSGKYPSAKYIVDPIFMKERTANLQEMGGYAEMVNDLFRNGKGEIDLDGFEKQLGDLVASGAIEKGTTFNGTQYQFTEEEQKKIIKVFKEVVKTNKKALIADIGSMLPSWEEEVSTASGRVKVSNILPIGMVSEAEAAVLTDLVLDLVESSDDVKTIKLGRGLAYEVKVPVKSFTKDELKNLAPLLQSRTLGFSQDMNRSLVRATVASEINGVLREMDPLTDVTTWEVEKLKKLPMELLVKGMTDAAGFEWLTSQIDLYLAL